MKLTRPSVQDIHPMPWNGGLPRPKAYWQTNWQESGRGVRSPLWLLTDCASGFRMHMFMGIR